MCFGMFLVKYVTVILCHIELYLQRLTSMIMMDCNGSINWRWMLSPTELCYRSPHLQALGAVILSCKFCLWLLIKSWGRSHMGSRASPEWQWSERTTPSVSAVYPPTLLELATIAGTERVGVMNDCLVRLSICEQYNINRSLTIDG